MTTISKQANFRLYFALLLSALSILGGSLFIMAPIFTKSFGPEVANLLYILVRVVTIVGLSFLLVKMLGKSRFQAVGSTVWVVLIDQTFFKVLLLQQELKADPKAWEGVTMDGMIYGTLSSFAVFLPVIILLAVMGAQLTKLSSEWKSGTPNRA